MTTKSADRLSNRQRNRALQMLHILIAVPTVEGEVVYSKADLLLHYELSNLAA